MDRRTGAMQARVLRRLRRSCGGASEVRLGKRMGAGAGREGARAYAPNLRGRHSKATHGTVW